MEQVGRYQPTQQDNELFEGITQMVRDNIKRFKPAGEALDREYSIQAIAQRIAGGKEEDVLLIQNQTIDQRFPSAANYEVELLEVPPETLSGRFWLAWHNAYGDQKGQTSLSVLKTDVEKLEWASRRVLLAWLYLDRDRSGLVQITKFQELQNIAEMNGRPPLWVENAADIPDLSKRINRHLNGSFSQDAQVWIPKLREGLEYMKRALEQIDEDDKQDDALGKGGKPRIGQKKEQLYRELLKDWPKAKADGRSREEFCKTKKVNILKLVNAQDWAKSRRKRGTF